MALRTTVATDTPSRTTNLPTAGGFTWCGWVSLSVDRNSTSNPFSYGPNTAAQKAMETDATGTKLNLWDGTNLTAMVTDMQVGMWYHLAFSWNGSVMVGYVNGLIEATSPSTATNPSTKIYFGNSVSNEFINGRLAHYRIWNAVLSQQEIAKEMRSTVPVRTASLNSWYPLDNLATHLLEAGGNGRGRREYDLTAGASAATTEGGPALFSPVRRNLKPTKKRSTGTLFTQALTATLSFVGAESNLTKKTLTAALSFVGAQNRAITRSLTATLNFVGAITKRTSRALTGGLSFSGAFSASHVFSVALTATLSFAGTMTKRTSRSLTGGLSFVGSCLKRTSRAYTATLSFVGGCVKQTQRAYGATLSFVGALATLLIHGGGTLYTIAFTATLSFTGALAKRASLAFDGTLGTSGSGIGRDIILVLDSARTRLAKRLSAFLYTLLD